MFSLFFVFLNNDVSASSEQFTIFAPSGLSTQEATRWLSAEERLTEELLLNHIVTGKHLVIVEAVGEAERYRERSEAVDAAIGGVAW